MHVWSDRPALFAHTACLCNVCYTEFNTIMELKGAIAKQLK